MKDEKKETWCKFSESADVTCQWAYCLRKLQESDAAFAEFLKKMDEAVMGYYKAIFFPETAKQSEA